MLMAARFKLEPYAVLHASIIVSNNASAAPQQRVPLIADGSAASR
jgi:hypothetical protein